MASYKHSAKDLLLKCRELYCDLCIVTSDGYVNCHKAVIAWASPLLRTVLRETDVDKIIVPTANKKFIKLLIDLLYCGEINSLTNADVMKLEEIINLFGLKWRNFTTFKEFLSDSEYENSDCDDSDTDYDPLSDNLSPSKNSKNEAVIPTTTKLFDCQFCVKKFSTLRTLVDHISTHALQGKSTHSSQKDRKPNPVPKQQIIIEKKLEKQVDPMVSCPQCKTDFKEPSTLILHNAQTHNETSPLQCPLCEKPVDKPEKLLNHVRIHRLAFKCPNCHESFPYCGRLRFHIKSIHSRSITPEELGTIVINSKLDEEPKEIPPAIVCIEEFAAERPYQCDDCQKWFSTRYYLRIHKRSHSGEKPFQCEVCAATFAEYSRWKKHYIRIHTKERAYPCPSCSMAFVSKAELDHHSRVHTGIRKKQCEVCGKKFGNASTLQVHMRTHTGDKPYQCHMCPMKFRCSSQRKRHIRVHTGERPYVCGVCGKGFTINSNLKIHSKVHRNRGARNNTV